MLKSVLQILLSFPAVPTSLASCCNLQFIPKQATVRYGTSVCAYGGAIDDSAHATFRTIDSSYSRDALPSHFANELCLRWLLFPPHLQYWHWPADSFLLFHLVALFAVAAPLSLVKSTSQKTVTDCGQAK